MTHPIAENTRQFLASLGDVGASKMYAGCGSIRHHESCLRTSETVAFAQRVRDIRHARGWTQRNLVDAASSTKNRIQALESGKLKLTGATAKRVAEILGISLPS